MADLKTNYKDDVLDTSKNEKRKFRMIQNDDGTVSFDDATEYTQQGDAFGAADINATNAKINEQNQSLTIMDDLNVHMIVGKGSYGWYHTNSVFVGKIKSINITHINIVGDASNNYEPSYHNNINYDNGGITFDIINGFLTMKFSDERIVNLIPFGTVVGIKGVILR